MINFILDQKRLYTCSNEEGLHSSINVLEPSNPQPKKIKNISKLISSSNSKENRELDPFSRRKCVSSIDAAATDIGNDQSNLTDEGRISYEEKSDEKLINFEVEI